MNVPAPLTIIIASAEASSVLLAAVMPHLQSDGPFAAHVCQIAPISTPMPDIPRQAARQPRAAHSHENATGAATIFRLLPKNTTCSDSARSGPGGHQMLFRISRPGTIGDCTTPSSSRVSLRLPPPLPCCRPPASSKWQQPHHQCVAPDRDCEHLFRAPTPAGQCPRNLQRCVKRVECAEQDRARSARGCIECELRDDIVDEQGKRVPDRVPGSCSDRTSRAAATSERGLGLPSITKKIDSD